jgi:ubiquinol-cytochrome c reductase cytochrome c subunit
MGPRLLRKILIPFAALVLAAAIATIFMGRVHGSTAASSPSMSPEAMSLASLSSQTTKGEISEGYELFQEHCSFCHGTRADGTTGIAPNLQGLGPGTVDLWLSTGWMPLKTPSAQPENKPPIFNPRQIRDVAMWVASLHPGGVPFAPSLNLKSASLSNGFSLFTLNCAPCHTITGAGDALANGYHAPGLHGVSASQVWEAVRSGPQNMPIFSDKTITPSQLDDIVKYVTGKIERPENPGGLGLGGVGPVAEGFVGLFAGVGACLAAAYWVGDRTEREEEENPHGPGSDHGPEGPDTAAEGAHA